MRAELRALVRVEPALEQRAQDRGVDLRPVERRGLERGLDPGLVQRQRGIVVEEPAVEPCHRLEPDPAAGGHRAQEVPRQALELLGPLARVLQHPGKHVVGQQTHVLGEHAEHEPVNEWATACGSWPRSRNDCASAAKVAAARSVSACPALARLQALGL